MTLTFLSDFQFGSIFHNSKLKEDSANEKNNTPD